MIQHDDFKTFLDSYEQNLQAQILIDERNENRVDYDSNKFELLNIGEELLKVQTNQDIHYGKSILSTL